jgi:hypothetical protein
MGDRLVDLRYGSTGRHAMEGAARRALALLEDDKVPTWDRYVVPPNAPTPLYWRTVMATGVQPGNDEPPSLAVRQHLGVARAPIPSRPLSYQARARRTDPQTSHDAARTVIKINDTHRQITALLRTFRDGLTDEQIADEWERNVLRLPHDWAPVSPSGLRSRRSELVRAGKVVDSGEKGRTVAGRACTIWRLADQ